MSPSKTLIVVGGGAAGFFCAVNAASLSENLQVIILEKSSKLLSKVKVSGGGRCNVTHQCSSISEMVKKYPRGSNFLKKTFKHFFVNDTIDWFLERGVELKAEADGRMFPVTNNSQTIVDCLMRTANLNSVKVQMNFTVVNVEQHADKWIITSDRGIQLSADFVCITTGGFPKAAQYNFLRNTGHQISSPIPSLFTFNVPSNAITELMGLSVADAEVSILGTRLSERGALLITHWGFSGPAVLRLSAWGAHSLHDCNYNFICRVNWLPQFNENSMLEQLRTHRIALSAQKAKNRNPFQIPARLWEFLLQQAAIAPEMNWADVPAKSQNKLAKLLCNMEFEVKGKTTFKEEFVTAGGVLTEDINPDTMESRKAKGLYFAGEIINVDGITGGFNFQHAWTSGMIAARAVASATNP